MRLCVGVLLLSGFSAQAQAPVQGQEPAVPVLLPPTKSAQPEQAPAQENDKDKPKLKQIFYNYTGLLKEDDFGVTSPQDVSKLIEKALDSKLPFGLAMYGWVEASYTYSSSGPGLMNVAPRSDRFGDEALLNSAALAIDRPLTQDWSWGFNVLFWGGADPATFYPSRGGLLGGSVTPVPSLGIQALTPGTPPNLRMAIDFTDLNLLAHLPIFTEGGIDVKIGRQSTPIRCDDTAKGPLRVFASLDYNTFYGTEGRFTGATATWHLTKQLEWYLGITEGFTSFFHLDTVGPNYITQMNYWLQEGRRTLLTCGVVTGPMTGDAGIAERFPQYLRVGQNTTQVELRLDRHCLLRERMAAAQVRLGRPFRPVQLVAAKVVFPDEAIPLGRLGVDCAGGEQDREEKDTGTHGVSFRSRSRSFSRVEQVRFQHQRMGQQPATHQSSLSRPW
jgi:hypothetical protein